MVVALNEKWPEWDRFKNRVSPEGGTTLEAPAGSGWNLFVFIPSPTEDEIKNIREGDFKISLVQPLKNPTIFFCIKFGSLRWQDAPYDVHLTQQSFGNTPIHEVEKGQGLALLVTLIDLDTGIVKVIRMFAMKNKTSNDFNNMIRKQLESDWDHGKTIQEYYSKYDPGQLAGLGTPTFVSDRTDEYGSGKSFWSLSVN
jgi:hypothetical protein